MYVLSHNSTKASMLHIWKFQYINNNGISIQYHLCMTQGPARAEKLRARPGAEPSRPDPARQFFSKPGPVRLSPARRDFGPARLIFFSEILIGKTLFFSLFLISVRSCKIYLNSLLKIIRVHQNCISILKFKKLKFKIFIKNKISPYIA